MLIIEPRISFHSRRMRPVDTASFLVFVMLENSNNVAVKVAWTAALFTTTARQVGVDVRNMRPMPMHIEAAPEARRRLHIHLR